MNAETNSEKIIGYMAWELNLGFSDLRVGETYTLDEAYINRCYTDRIYDGLYLTLGSPMNFPEYGASAINLLSENCSYFKVAAHKNDVLYEEGDEKSVEKVKILEKLTRDDIVKRQFEIAKNSPCFHKYANENETIASDVEDAKLLLSGRHSSAATSGYGTTIVIDACGVDPFLSDSVTFASSGKCSAVASLARYSSHALAGSHSFIETQGYGSSVATSGSFTELSIKSVDADVALSGDFSALKSTAKEATIAIAGSYSNTAILGEHSVIVIAGKSANFKGVEGTHVCVADYGNDGTCHGFVTGRIGENGLKENTFYTVKNGRFIEAPAKAEAAE